MKYIGTPPFDGEFWLKCRHCGSLRKVLHHINCGWQVGYVVPHDGSDSTIGRCLRCKRYTMEVVQVPPEPEQVPPEGFDMIPQK